jgi:glycosyltransferase involved in cell wall biosynthesis
LDHFSKPLVSVWVITYNHAGFIGECLDSILTQETNFFYEICLGEDESNDGTREICKEYAKKYHKKIRLFLRDRNDPAREGCKGVWQFNFIETFKACRGKYIALCDGDDFWSDPYKLQKQVDFLENHPECSGCYHKISQIDEAGNCLHIDMGYPPRRQEYYSLDYLLQYSNFSPMLSVVFKNHAEVAPEWIKEAPFGDMIIHAGNLLQGDYGFIDEVMGNYRIHGGGLASSASRLNNVKVTLDVYRLIGEKFNLSDRPSFFQGIRALKISYLAEWLMQKVLPVPFKKKIDAVYGVKIRSIVRRILMLGSNMR